MRSISPESCAVAPEVSNCTRTLPSARCRLVVSATGKHGNTDYEYKHDRFIHK